MTGRVEVIIVIIIIEVLLVDYFLYIKNKRNLEKRKVNVISMINELRTNYCISKSDSVGIVLL